MTRTRRRLRAAAAGAGVAGAVAVLAACGTGGIDKSSDTSGGKELFVSKCGSCHVLADAGTTGKIGPDLDASFGPSREQGFKESTIRQVVRDQIHFPSPGNDEPGFPEMPADLVKGADADAVAAYVASVAGTGTAPAPTSSGTATTPTPSTTSTTTTTAPESGGDATKGKSLFNSLACSSCHSIDGSPGVGPTFKGLSGSKVELTNGKSVAADVAYLVESIDDPDAEIVKGYQPGLMSSVIKPHQVAEADVRDLVAYIKSLR